MKFVIISSLASMLAGMGMGGGSLFIILGLLFLELPQKTLQGLNLIMFISSGISATVSNFKNKLIDKNLSKRMAPCLALGSIVGVYITSKIKEEKLRKYFLIFITIIGIYEIISSLIDIKKAKTNNEN